MKKALSFILMIAIVFVFGISSASYTDSETDRYTLDEAYKYPVTIRTEEWSKLDSKEAKIEACKVSEDILSSMTTRALIELLIDMCAYNTIEIGIGYVSRHFKGIEILEAREDALPILTKYVEDISKSKATLREFVYASEILEYLKDKSEFQEDSGIKATVSTVKHQTEQM